MTIIYAVICRAKDAAVLTEVCDSDVKGTMGSVMVELLQHLRDNPDLFHDGDLKTFVQRNEAENDFFSHFWEACTSALSEDDETVLGEHYFHLYFKTGIFYCCLGDDPDQRDQKVNFAFLHAMEEEFVKAYRPGRIKTANAYSLNQGFSPTMRSSMHYHNVHQTQLRQDAKVGALAIKVQDISDVMGRNLHLILQRGEKFDGLLDKTETLSADAQIFRKKARVAKRTAWVRYYYWYMVLAAIILFILYIFMASMCGFTMQQCRGDTSNSNGNANGNNEGGGRMLRVR